MQKDVLLCPHCSRAINQISPTEFDPAPLPGSFIEGLSSEIEVAYAELRRCLAIGAFLAVELLARRLLMHIGAELGAKENQNFAAYVDYLEQQGHITQSMKPWVDQIRKFGNQATHELVPPNKDRATLSFTFSEMLLRSIYEMPHKLRGFSQ
tara:strand:- start:56 stop:511 length:456 start_codon:yes stop_codon:yes gene_type:complete